MSTQPTDEEIDAVTLEVLGYAALDKNTNETARLIARAVLAKWGTPAPARADSVREDAARLDWLDQQCEAYGFQDIHEGNRWEISGAYANVREAIDAARKQGANHDNA